MCIKIHPSLEVTYNEELDCLDVRNTNQPNNENYVVHVDKDLPVVKEGGNVIVNPHRGYARYCEDGKTAYIHRLIMQDEIDQYKQEHPDYNGEPFIDHINHDRLDNRRCNLRVVTSRENNFNTEAVGNGKRKYIGVHTVHNKTKEDTFRAMIRTPDNSSKTSIVYDNPEDAALAYDYYAREYYPDSTGTTNLELGKFDPEFLESRGINSINDIELPSSNLAKWSTVGNEYDYIGVGSDGHKGILVKAKDSNGNRQNLIHLNAKEAKTANYKDLAVKRERWMDENGSTSKSNVIYPSPRKGMVALFGILAKKSERKEIEAQMKELDKKIDAYDKEKIRNTTEEEVLDCLGIKI